MPVIQTLHPFLIGGDHGMYRFILLLRSCAAGHHRDPIRVQGARAVELAAIQTPLTGLLWIGLQRGLQLAYSAQTSLGRGITKNRPLACQWQPLRLRGLIPINQQSVDETEMRAQNLGDV
uniref:Uncharacterized protein n=1 Tax=Panagrolaimus superbus TaxID=310955 RepID=A0A914YHR5_9BILA